MSKIKEIEKYFLTKEFYNIKEKNNKINTNRYLNSYNKNLNQIFKKEKLV